MRWIHEIKKAKKYRDTAPLKIPLGLNANAVLFDLIGLLLFNIFAEKICFYAF